MVQFYGIIIIAAIIIWLFIKAIFYLYCSNEEETISDKMISGGIALLGATVPSSFDPILKFLYDFLRIQESEAETGVSLWVLIALGLLLLIIGIVLKILDSKAKYVILNMPGTIHHTKMDGLLKPLRISNCEEIETSTSGCQIEMPKLSQTRANDILKDIQLQMERFNRQSHCKRCFTGMAPIPFVVYAGTKHRGNDINYYLEYNRATQKYTKLNGEKHYPALHKPVITAVNTNEIVVKVSTTARVNEVDTRQFKTSVFSLGIEDPKDNAIFSKRQLNEYVNETVTFISDVCKNNSGITRVNLLMATQACFAYALGKALVQMQNRVPEIVSYHYIVPSYKVGLVVNGNSSGKVIKM